jgi:hypothetical protein
MADLLKEAIADAKAVRETAIANAKSALEEAFTPKLQSMLSARINEQDEFLDDDEDEDAMTADIGTAIDNAEEEEEGGDLELESIIRELEGDDEDEDEDELAMEGEIEKSSGIGNGTSFNDMSGSTPDPSGKETGANGTNAITGSDLLEQDFPMTDEDEDEDESLEEVLRSLRENDEEEEEEEENGMLEARHMAGAYEGKLREAYGTIQFLRGKINEVNLLNAKLLFSNKLFRAGSLNESQKLKVIDTFDRAKSLREVKLVYSTLAESFKPVISGARMIARKTISEGYPTDYSNAQPTGYASKSTGTTKPRQVITEGQIQSSRFQKLAGLIK